MGEQFGIDRKSIILVIVIIIVSTLLILLMNNYIRLESEYRSLNTAFSRVSSELSSVQQSHILLLAKYDTLSIKYSSLEELYNGLEEDYVNLKNEYEDLSLKYEQLNSEHSHLIKDKEDIEAWYLSLMKHINIRQGFGEEKTLFITPDDPEVRSVVLGVTGGWSNPSEWSEFWIDVEKLYNWVVNNVAYSYDSPTPVLPNIMEELYWREECFRFPNETIRQRRGDCEDQAILLASMILSYSNERHSIWVIQWVSDEVGHAAVAIPVGNGRLTIFDPAGRFYTSDSLGRVNSKDVRTAVEEWLAYWKRQGYSNIRICAIFSKNLYREFLSTEEFIQWVLRS